MVSRKVRLDFHNISTHVEIDGAAFFMTLWDKVLQHTERRVNPHSFATWFRPTRQERAEDNKLIVRVPTRLFCKRLKESCGE